MGYGRRSPYKKRQSKRTGLVITSILIFGVIGFMFVNGIFAFNQEKLDDSIQKISDTTPSKFIEDTKNTISELNVADSDMSSHSIEKMTNKIYVGRGNGGSSLYAEITPYKLQVIENPRYNEINFALQVKVLDLGFDESVFVDVGKTVLVDENSKKYMINLRDCVSPSLAYLINGKNEDTKAFGVCFDVDKNAEKFDIFFSGPSAIDHSGGPTKVGTIHLVN